MITIYGKVHNPIYGDIWQRLWMGESASEASIEFQKAIENSIYPQITMEYQGPVVAMSVK